MTADAARRLFWCLVSLNVLLGIILCLAAIVGSVNP